MNSDWVGPADTAGRGERLHSAVFVGRSTEICWHKGQPGSAGGGATGREGGREGRREGGREGGRERQTRGEGKGELNVQVQELQVPRRIRRNRWRRDGGNFGESNSLEATEKQRDEEGLRGRRV